MSLRPAPMNIVARRRNTLRLFYSTAFACAVAVGVADRLHHPQRELLVALAIGLAVCAVWCLLRFLRATDEFEKQINYRALKFAFVSLLTCLLAEAFLEGCGLPRVPPYGNAALAIVLWSLGLILSSRRYA